MKSEEEKISRNMWSLGYDTGYADSQKVVARLIERLQEIQEAAQNGLQSEEEAKKEGRPPHDILSVGNGWLQRTTSDAIAEASDPDFSSQEAARVSLLKHQRSALLERLRLMVRRYLIEIEEATVVIRECELPDSKSTRSPE